MRFQRWLTLTLSCLLFAGCDKDDPAPEPDSSAEPETTTSASSAPAGPAPRRAPPDPSALAITPLEDVKECTYHEAYIGSYLQRGDVAVAGNERGEIGVAWLIQLVGRPQAQVAFGGYDAQAKTLGPERKVGDSKFRPRVFPSKDGWIVSWFTDESLSGIYTTWDIAPPPTVASLHSLGADAEDRIGLAVAPEGGLAVAAEVDPSSADLALFRVGTDRNGSVDSRAIGVSKHIKAKSTTRLARDDGGYLLVWEAEGALWTTRFDPSGKEQAKFEIAPKAEAAREDLAIATTNEGAVVVWREGEKAHVTGIGKTGAPRGTPVELGAATWLALARHPEGAIATLSATHGDVDLQLIAVPIGADGVPGANRVRISQGRTPLKDPPAIARSGDNFAFVWTEAMSPSIASRRLILRVASKGCFEVP